MKRLYGAEKDGAVISKTVSIIILSREMNAVNPSMNGTKATANYDIRQYQGVVLPSSRFV